MRPFKDHPASVGETYLQHMGCAFSFGWTMLLSGLACIIHGVFPFLFTTRGRDTITELHDRMVVHRDQQCEAAVRARREKEVREIELTPAE